MYYFAYARVARWTMWGYLVAIPTAATALVPPVNVAKANTTAHVASFKQKVAFCIVGRPLTLQQQRCGILRALKQHIVEPLRTDGTDLDLFMALDGRASTSELRLTPPFTLQHRTLSVPFTIEDNFWLLESAVVLKKKRSEPGLGGGGPQGQLMRMTMCLEMIKEVELAEETRYSHVVFWRPDLRPNRPLPPIALSSDGAILRVDKQGTAVVLRDSVGKLMSAPWNVAHEACDPHHCACLLLKSNPTVSAQLFPSIGTLLPTADLCLAPLRGFWATVMRKTSMQLLATDRDLPPLLTKDRSVAACIAGSARALPARTSGVFTNYRKQVQNAMRATTMHWYYVVDLQGGSHSGLQRRSFSYNESDFAEVFRALPPKRKVFNPTFQQGGSKKCTHACTVQYQKLAVCMDLIREVERAEHFRYTFVVRLRTDNLFRIPFPPVQSLKRAVYASFVKHGVDDHVGIAHRDFSDALFGMTRLPHASSCGLGEESQIMLHICTVPSCECLVKLSFVFHNATWVNWDAPKGIVRKWR